jgi:uncharacterized protein (DUF488 family)
MVTATLYTIGFTKTSAEHFFERLRQAGVKRLVDIRLHNTSTLAGFSKRGDLQYFLRTILGAAYLHQPLLAPAAQMLKAYQNKLLAWDDFAAQYVALIQSRGVGTKLDRAVFEGPTVLLCGEASADHCHRRLAAEYLRTVWGDLEIEHL